MTSHGKLFCLPLLALALTALPACAAAPTELVHGQVVEEGTNRPLPGVIVIARWTETQSVFPESRTYCAHVESALTDAQGRFSLPGYKGRPPTLLDGYKIGYENSRGYVRREPGFNDFPLKPFTGSRGERLEYLKRIEETTRCNVESERQKVRLPLLRALSEEARSIAVTKEDRRVVNSLLFVIDSMELGEEKAFSNLNERRKADNE